jgi:hypothetical protein
MIFLLLVLLWCIIGFYFAVKVWLNTLKVLMLGDLVCCVAASFIGPLFIIFLFEECFDIGKIVIARKE